MEESTHASKPRKTTVGEGNALALVRRGFNGLSNDRVKDFGVFWLVLTIISKWCVGRQNFIGIKTVNVKFATESSCCKLG